MVRLDVLALVVVSALSVSVSGCGHRPSGSDSVVVLEEPSFDVPPVELVIESHRPGPNIFEPEYFPVDWNSYQSSFDSSSESLTVRIRKGDTVFDTLQDGHVLSVSDGDRKILFLVVECNRSIPGKIVIHGLADTWYGVEKFEKYR